MGGRHPHRSNGRENVIGSLWEGDINIGKMFEMYIKKIYNKNYKKETDYEFKCTIK